MAVAELRKISDQKAELQGDLLNTTVVAVIAPGKTLMAQAGGHWTLDMSGVERVSSAGVALLLEWLRESKRLQQTFKIENLPAHMRPILDISDLEPLFEPLLN